MGSGLQPALHRHGVRATMQAMSEPTQAGPPLDPLRFAVLVAHQLRAPIGTAGSLLKALLEEHAGALTPRQKDALARADHRLDEAVETVRRMLTLIRPDAASGGSTDLAALLHRLHQQHAAEAAAAHLEMRVETPDGSVFMRGSEDALAEAFHALINNALKYTPAHGQVVLRAERLPGRGMVRGSVADSGVGIPEDQRDLIFQPYYRAPSARQSAAAGVGLGLSLVKAMAEALGGTVGVERSEYGGALFHLDLPEAHVAESPGASARRRVVIIGGVAAGTKVASKLARLDPDTEVILVERGDILAYAGCGLPYYISAVVKNRRELMSTPVGSVRDPVFFQNLKHVRALHRTEAVEIDRARKMVRIRHLDSGRISQLSYDQLVLATGARPIRPALPGIELPRIFTLHGVRDAEGIRSLLDGGRAHDVVIVGGGLIGVETTEALVSRGCRVTIVEMGRHILRILDEEMAMLLEKHMESHCVRVLTETCATGFVGKERVEGVSTDTHGVIPADMVILGVGVQPESALARAAGLDIGVMGGIRVDAHLRTSDPDIFAAGDCVECTDLVTGRPCYVPLGSTANKQGRVAAVNLCGGHQVFPGVLGSTVCKVFDYCVGRTGLTEGEAREAGFDPVSVLLAAPDREHFMPGARLLCMKLVADRTSRRLLGLQTLGSGGDKRIDIAATAITAGMTVDQVAQLDLCYAPPYSPAMDNLITAANIAGNKLDGRLHGISPQELWARLQSHENLVLLDLSTTAEHEALRLPNSQSIPLGTLRGRLGELPRDRDIVAFCRLSIRGYEAALILQKAGFERVRVLDGGTAMWPYDVVTGKA